MFDFEERGSDSSFVELIWRNRSQNGGPFTSIAVSHWQLVVTRYEGRTTMTVRGPETKASHALAPAGAEHFGVYFQVGTYIPQLPASRFTDGMVDLPQATGNSFWLGGSAWEYPTYENADLFVDRLVRAGLLVRERAVEAVLHGASPDLSVRSLQRRFLHTTGLTFGAVRQIERARRATLLLRAGASISEIAFQAGYSDQPHLTRALKRYVGQTPGQLREAAEPLQLSVLSSSHQFAQP